MTTPVHSLTECIALACVLEATAAKPGNVHRSADFDDVSFPEFLVAGLRIAEPLAQAANVGVGAAARNAVIAARECVASNCNLGIILLLAPLAAVSREQSLEQGISRVLNHLSPADAAGIWEAIQLARPGGLGRAEKFDVHEPPPDDILTAMRLAADRDRIAYQYVHGYRDLFESLVPWLIEARQQGWSLTESIIHTHMRCLARFPDSLIARKAGAAVAKEASAWAAQILSRNAPGSEEYYIDLADFDFWLRSDGRQRNPGTTADLIAATLFIVLRDRLIQPPYR